MRSIANWDWNIIGELILGIIYVCVIVAIIIGLIALVIGAFQGMSKIESVCASRNNASQMCIDYRMDTCLNSELYTREECIQLAK